jgi:hypothetical protein
MREAMRGHLPDEKIMDDIMYMHLPGQRRSHMRTMRLRMMQVLQRKWLKWGF